jgi:hypothetical protein
MKPDPESLGIVLTSQQVTDRIVTLRGNPVHLRLKIQFRGWGLGEH